MNPLESWTEEQRSAFLYRACATAEQGTKRAELFRRLAGEAEAQAAIWRAQLTARGHPAPGPYQPDARTRIVARLVQAVGPRRLRRVLAAMKVRGMVIYAGPERDEGHALPRADGVIEHRHRIWAAAATCAPRSSASTMAWSPMPPDPRRRRRRRRAARRRHRRRRRPVRGRLLDGDRRIRFGPLAARALRIPDRSRARRAHAVSGSRSAGARADLRGEGLPQKEAVRLAGRSSPIPSTRSTRSRARSSA